MIFFNSSSSHRKLWVAITFLSIILFISCKENINKKLPPITVETPKNRIGNTTTSAYDEFWPALKYQYDDYTQTYDLSNNWDFDNDGINDQLLIIGEGGAHLYYHLSIQLSSTGGTEIFDDYSFDVPEVRKYDSLAKYHKLFGPSSISAISIFDYTSEGIPDIYLAVRRHTISSEAPILSTFSKNDSITFVQIILTVENGKFKTELFDGVKFTFPPQKCIP